MSTKIVKFYYILKTFFQIIYHLLLIFKIAFIWRKIFVKIISHCVDNEHSKEGMEFHISDYDSLAFSMSPIKCLLYGKENKEEIAVIELICVYLN